MKLTIRSLCLLLPLASCSSAFNGLNQSIASYKILNNPENYIQKQIEKNLTYDTQYIFNSSIDDHKFFVESIDGERQKWINSNDKSFYALNGRIYRTFGLNNNFLITSLKNIDIKKLIEVNTYKSSSLIEFTNPKTGPLELNSKYELIEKGSRTLNDKTFDYILVKELFNVPSIQWSGNNYYWISNNRIFESKQYLLPYESKYRIYEQKNSD
tara:strand:+ start:6693 stop:7328 length:636 start_codon:yes stop_codon:yes gene_type:complete